MSEIATRINMSLITSDKPFRTVIANLDELGGHGRYDYEKSKPAIDEFLLKEKVRGEYGQERFQGTFNADVVHSIDEERVVVTFTNLEMIVRNGRRHLVADMQLGGPGMDSITKHYGDKLQDLQLCWRSILLIGHGTVKPILREIITVDVVLAPTTNPFMLI